MANIFNQLRIYSLPNCDLYLTLKKWNETISREVNESSISCFPDGIKGISFGDRLNAIVYITLYYLHFNMFIKRRCDDVLPIPGIDNDYWERAIEDITSAIMYRKSNIREQLSNRLINNLYSAVDSFLDWECFVSSTIGFYEDDDITMSIIEKMAKIQHSDETYEERPLLSSEVELLTNAQFKQCGQFSFISPVNIEWYNEQPFYGQIHSPLFVMTWDKRKLYKTGDIVEINGKTKILFNESNMCVVLE